MCPYLLWLSSDKKAGDLYLKIDRLSFYCGHFNLESEDGQGIFLKGFDLLFKAYHVFHREYHVYLSAFMNFIESVYKIGGKQSASTKSLRGYISSYRKKQQWVFSFQCHVNVECIPFLMYLKRAKCFTCNTLYLTQVMGSFNFTLFSYVFCAQYPLQCLWRIAKCSFDCIQLFTCCSHVS